MKHAHDTIDAEALRRTQALMSELLDRHGAAALERVIACLGIMAGLSPAPTTDPRQRPERVFFPGLGAKPWHAPADSSALRTVVDALEEAYPEIREEAETLLRGRRGGVVSYLDATPRDAGRRREKFRGLGDDDWTVQFLRSEAGVDPAGAASCPATMRALAAMKPHLLHRGDALFSILRPGARIPPHHDGTNYKLTVHLGLVVPPGCELVVGGVSRRWEEGRCLAFDDTFLHEARNDSPTERVCLLVDVWHPDLTMVEREAIARLIDAALDEPRLDD